jgi:hypothetical protein
MLISVTISGDLYAFCSSSSPELFLKIILSQVIGVDVISPVSVQVSLLCSITGLYSTRTVASPYSVPDESNSQLRTMSLQDRF